MGVNVGSVRDRLAKIDREWGGGDPFEKKVIVQGDNIVRVVGNDLEVKRSWIACDTDNKNRPFNVEGTILEEIIENVLEFEIATDKRGKRYRKFLKKENHKRAFKIVYRNDSEQEDDRGWRPQTITLMNCIDREDGWCKSNDHLKLLVKTKGEIGIGGTAWKGFATVVDKYGSWEDYDICFTKTGSGKNDTTYSAKKAPLTEECTVDGPLTDEERGYDAYDLKEISAPTPAATILRYLTDSIGDIDEDLGTDYLKRLKKQVKAEAKDDVSDMKDAADDDDDDKPKKGSSKKGSSRGDKKKKSPEEDDDKEDPEDEDDGEPAVKTAGRRRKKKESVPTEPCPECKKPFPVTDTKCPHCGEEFEVD